MLATLNSLRVTPPANSDADFTLNLSATTTENGTTLSPVTSALPIRVRAVADLTTIPTNSVSTLETSLSSRRCS